MRYTIFSNSVCPILNISCIGYAKNPEVTRFGTGVRNLYIIHYVISGKGYFNGNPVYENQGFLITPNMQEYYYPDKKMPWEFLWIISDDERMAQIFKLFGADKNTNIFSYNCASTVKELSKFLIEQNNLITNSFELLEKFMQILKHQQKESVENFTKTNAEIYIESAVKYIQSNVHTPISVDELTKFLGISQPYLFNLFKAKFKISPKEFILREKLTRAKTLLKETSLSVTHIGNSVGFQDVLSFSKFFKNRVGVSPQNYRNEY